MTKKVNKMIILFVSVIISLNLSACGNEGAASEKTLKSYIEFVDEKKTEEAYALLDSDNLPEKKQFEESIINEKDIKSFKILKSKKVDKNTYKFLTNIEMEKDLNSELVFVVVKKKEGWRISLNTSPDQKPKEF